MRIAFIGTSCAGKTTIINQLKQCGLFKHYYFGEEPIRVVGRLGFSVNKKADDASQLAMVAIHENYLKEKNLISDRSLVDAYVYSNYLYKNHGVVSEKRNAFIFNTMWDRVKDYDILFFCHPITKQENDGFRDTDPIFQADINKEFLSIKKAIDMEYPGLIVELSGDRKQRFDKALQYIMEHKDERI